MQDFKCQYQVGYVAYSNDYELQGSAQPVYSSNELSGPEIAEALLNNINEQYNTESLGVFTRLTINSISSLIGGPANAGVDYKS